MFLGNIPSNEGNLIAVLYVVLIVFTSGKPYGPPNTGEIAQQKR